MHPLRISVLGGTGFIGSHLVHRLSSQGHQVSLVTRRPERHRQFKLDRSLQLVQANLADPVSLTELFRHSDCVINLIGILNETGNSRFQTAHVEIPRNVVKAMREAGTRRLLHMSALNADVNESRSMYLKTKGEGEDLVHNAPGLSVTSFRPSVVFGSGDSFFNRFAALLRTSPLVFPLACPDSRFAPVYVGDVVDAFTAALEREQTAGQRLELCGPASYSLEQLVGYTASLIGRRTLIAGLPDFASRLQAHMLGLVPGKPFTIDNYYSLQKDSVCRESALSGLGIRLHSVEAIVPTYLGDRNYRARYNRYRAEARRQS
jgi:NADH dehydrogenase